MVHCTKTETEGVIRCRSSLESRVLNLESRVSHLKYVSVVGIGSHENLQSAIYLMSCFTTTRFKVKISSVQLSSVHRVRNQDKNKNKKMDYRYIKYKG